MRMANIKPEYEKNPYKRYEIPQKKNFILYASIYTNNSRAKQINKLKTNEHVHASLH